MKICVLQPDYSTSDVDYKHYDPVRDLSHLMPGATFRHVLLNKLSVYRQLKELKKENFDVFVNLCEGYLEWSVPSIDVIYFLELLDLPFTGPPSSLYDPPKHLMKYVAYTEGVRTPSFAVVESLQDAVSGCSHLNFPLFVKPGKAGDSLGIDRNSRVNDSAELLHKCAEIIDEYGPLLVEEYIEGREFTVMLVANSGDKGTCTAFKPIEYVFPEGFQFKTYALKTSELHPEANIACADAELEAQLKDAAIKIFQGFSGVGYARLDFRVNAQQEIYFLEINFTCSVFYKDGYEGSADYILKADGIGQAGFLQRIVDEGIARHRKKRKSYAVKGNSVSGYGIYSTRDIEDKELVFNGEEQPHRIVTRGHVSRSWCEKEKAVLKKYGYPLSNEVFLLWDSNPDNWAPQNHSCNPNTRFEGLNVIAIRNIAQGEELTLDYSAFLDESMESFDCRCGSPNCRGRIFGTNKNSVASRESAGHN